jgi:D-alanyl-D-alanine carboxypeptidase
MRRLTRAGMTAFSGISQRTPIKLTPVTGPDTGLHTRSDMNGSQYSSRTRLSQTCKTPSVRKGWLSASVSGMIMSCLLGAVTTTPVMAQELEANARASAIVIDAQTGEVLYARRADSARYPASLTKVMTLYLAFEALANGQLKSTDLITMSRRANSQAPVKIGFRDGDTITVDAAMRLIAVYSANDLSVALAEKIGGSEERFAALMTIRAQELGMTATRFVNANGLPDERQLSSARDFAVLMRATLRDYPQYYSYLNVQSYAYGGRTYVNHNPVRDLDGVDGGKTGFTRAAGYNLVTSQTKGGRRLIAVMMGSSNKDARRETIAGMMDSGFDILNRRANGERIEVAQAEIGQALAGRSSFSGPQPYTVLASNTPMSKSQLLDTLAGSEEANAEEDVERLSATATAPAVARALLPPQASVPQQAYVAPSATAVPQPLPSTARPYAPAAETVSLSTMPRETTLAAAQREKLKTAAIDADDCATVSKASAKSTAKGAKASKVKASATTSKAKGKATLQKTSAHKASAKCKVKKDPTAVWAVQVGAFKQKSQASEWALSVKKRFKLQLAKADSDVSKNEHGWYRTRFVEMTEKQAKAACLAIDAKRLDCTIVKPEI